MSATARFTFTMRDGSTVDSHALTADNADPQELARWFLGRVNDAVAIRLWVDRDLITPTWGLGQPDAEVAR